MFEMLAMKVVPQVSNEMNSRDEKPSLGTVRVFILLTLTPGFTTVLFFFIVKRNTLGWFFTSHDETSLFETRASTFQLLALKKMSLKKNVQY